MVPDNVTLFISPSGSATNILEIVTTIGSLAGLIALGWNVKNSLPQIDVTLKESWHYDLIGGSKDPNARICIISIANHGKVPIKIESSGFLVDCVEEEIIMYDGDYPPKILISGERCDRYHDSKELAKKLSIDIGIMLHFGNIVKIRAFCKDQTGKIYRSKIFKFDVELKEGNVPRLLDLNLGSKTGKTYTTRKGASFHRSLYRLKQRWYKLLGKDRFKSRMEYAISKQNQNDRNKKN